MTPFRSAALGASVVPVLACACALDVEVGSGRNELSGLLSDDPPLSSTTPQAQNRPVAAVAAAGITLVVFHDASPTGTDPPDPDNIRGVFVRPDGTPVGRDFLINTTVTGAQDRPDVAAADDGTFLVVWQDSSLAAPDVSGSGIRARHLRFDAATGAPSFLGPDFVVPSNTATSQVEPAVAAATAGSFVVVWHDRVHVDDAVGYGVRMRRIDADGVPLLTDTQVNSTTALDQTAPDIAVALDGSFVVTFVDSSGTGDTAATGIRARRFDATGAPLGPDAVVNATIAGAQSEPAIAAADAGTYLVAWTDASGSGDASSTGIRARRLATTGAPTGTEVQVNSTTAGAQSAPAVGFDAAGASFFLAWTDASGAAPDTAGTAIRVRRFLADSTFAEPDLVIAVTTTGSQTQPSLVQRATSALLFAWSSPDSSSIGVRGRMLLVACPANTTTDFYADAAADRTGMPTPTGVRTPAACAYPTLTQALVQASAAAAGSVPARAVASRDSVAGSPITYFTETFPWQVPARVTVTTTDDPDLGGNGFSPASFRVIVRDQSQSSPASVRLLGASSRTGQGGGVRGLSFVQQACVGCPPVAIRVEGLGVMTVPRVAGLEVHGTGTWRTGVEVRGDAWITDLAAEGFISTVTEASGLYVFNDGGANAADRVLVSDSTLSGNNIGLRVSGGTVELSNVVATDTVQNADGTGGHGIVIRDWRATATSRIITPTTLSSSGLISENNGASGVQVDLMDATSSAYLDDSRIDWNAGDGVQVLGAPRQTQGAGQLWGAVLSGSTIYNNGEDGIRLGSTTQAVAVFARASGNEIWQNTGAGLSVWQSAAVGGATTCPSDGVTGCTGATIDRNVIFENQGPGVELHSAMIWPFSDGSAAPAVGFMLNRLYRNTGVFIVFGGCSAGSDAQIVVDGPTAWPQGSCPAQVNEFTCRDRSLIDPSSHCVWTPVGCQAGWDLRAGTDSCSTRNWTDGYGLDDDPNTVGVRAENGAIVNAEMNVWESGGSSADVAYDGSSYVDATPACGFGCVCGPEFCRTAGQP